MVNGKIKVNGFTRLKSRVRVVVTQTGNRTKLVTLFPFSLIHVKVDSDCHVTDKEEHVRQVHVKYESTYNY